MTKEQAREYATRIRLGEEVWGAGTSGACFADGTLIAEWEHGAMWNTPSVGWVPTAGLKSPAGARWGNLRVTSLPALLAALDRVANS